MGDDGFLFPSEARERELPQPTPDNLRRVSAASVATSTQTTDEPERPTLPERKKSSGWGSLGFKLGSNDPKPGSGGSWFGRSGSATPPKATVGLEQDMLEKEGKGLDAPIDLQAQVAETTAIDAIDATEETKNDVPRIETQDASPAAPLSNLASRDGESHEAQNLKPVLSRAGSTRSNATSIAGTEDGTFSTPKGQANDLPDEDVPEAADVSTISDTSKQEVETANVVYLNENVDPAPTPAPPPIPRRSANRMSKPATPLTSTSPVLTGNTPLPAVIALPAKDSEEVRSDPAAPVETATSSAEADESASEIPAPTESTRKAPPPPLPARHPQTPANPSVPDHHVEGEKRWMKEDSEAWEDKTWRTVLRLKEGMWKARVGVSDETDN